MPNIGLKISKEGFDVKTATDNNLVFTSKYPALKIKSQGQGTKKFLESVDAEPVITEFEIVAQHDLGYRPMFLGYCDFGTGNEQIPLIIEEDTGMGIWKKHFYFTSTEEVLYLVCSAVWMGTLFTLTDPSEIEVNYSWILFFDELV